MKSKLFPLLVPVLSTAVVLTSCGQSDEPQQSAADNGVTVTNCGKEMTYAQADNRGCGRFVRHFQPHATAAMR
ncbi:hypothetical protein CIP107532_00608 [Corynebacterium diphtheriae]|nr:hypothetical protein CIP107532_00608 [Corynebacterium diphtheriae]